MSDLRWVYVCDICKDVFDDPQKAVRLTRVGEYVVVAGRGSGMADLVVHEDCLVQKGNRIGNLKGGEGGDTV